MQRLSPVQTLKGHPFGTYALAFSPQGGLLASGGHDCEPSLWHIPGGRRRVLTGHGSLLGGLGNTLGGGNDLSYGAMYGVRCLAFSRDGLLLATGSFDQNARLWDVRSQRLLATLKGGRSTVHGVAFSPDGQHLALATGYFCRTPLQIWSTLDHCYVAGLKGHRRALMCVAYSPAGDFIASGSLDRMICLWDAREFVLREMLTGHRSSVHALAFSPNGDYLASLGRDGELIVWSWPGGIQRTRCQAHDGGNAMAISPDGRIIATCGGVDRLVKLWQPGASEPCAVGAGPRYPVIALAFAPDCNLLASGGFEHPGQIALWDLADTQTIAAEELVESIRSVDLEIRRENLAKSRSDIMFFVISTVLCTLLVLVLSYLRII